MVRVLHLISDAGPHPFFEPIGAHADRERFDVRLATVGPPGALQDDARRMDLHSFALGARGRWDYPRAVVALARRLRRDRIDVIQTHLLDGCFVGLLAARLARTPVAIMTAHHSHEIPLHNRRTLTAVDRLCAGKFSDAIVAPSAQMRDTLVGVHRAPIEKISVIHHGFELDRLDPARINHDRVRNELGLGGRLVIGSIGRIFWVKNQAGLVRAFARVVPSAPEATLLLVGDGDPSSITALAGSLGISDRVVVLARRPDVPELLASMDLFVHAALAESFGMVIVEAMAMGVPVVSAPVGIAPEVIEEGVTGILAADATSAGLEDALRRALDLRDRWFAWGAESLSRAANFRADRMVSAYETLYDRLCAER
jgi:glycosyltransferase involved in cell wall biosynthesis